MKKAYLILTFVLGMFIAQAQNVYEFYIASYAKSKSLREVHFNYKLNGKDIKDETTKTGENTFVIMQDKGRYVLTASKEGFATKYFYFNTDNYPFEYEYELQDVAVEFVALDKSEQDYQMGEVMWNHQEESFQVVDIDSSMLPENQPKASEQNKMDQTYALAIKNGDEKFNQQNYRHAISYYEVALFAKKDDPYATQMLTKCNTMFASEEKSTEPDEIAEKPKTGNSTGGTGTVGAVAAVVVDAALLDKINRGEVTSVDASHIDESIIFSVQLGAFASGTDASKFPGVPDLKIIPYDDFTRCFSGEFNDVNQAIARRKEMRAGKYKDAFIVKMKGHKRIGF